MTDPVAQVGREGISAAPEPPDIYREFRARERRGMLDVSIDPDFLPEPVFVRDPLGDPLNPLDPEIPGRELFDLGTRIRSSSPSGTYAPEIARIAI
jgi:hypothetical protein